MHFLSSIEIHLLKFTQKIFSGMKILPVNLVFSSWVNAIKKVPIINRSRNSKSLKGIYFFEIGKLIFFPQSVFVYLRLLLFSNLRLAVLELFQKISDFIYVYVRSLTLFQLSVGYVLNFNRRPSFFKRARKII